MASRIRITCTEFIIDLYQREQRQAQMRPYWGTGGYSSNSVSTYYKRCFWLEKTKIFRNERAREKNVGKLLFLNIVDVISLVGVCLFPKRSENKNRFPVVSMVQKKYLRGISINYDFEDQNSSTYSKTEDEFERK